MRTFLKYYFTAYVLAVALVVGIAGFRGSKSTKPPLAIYGNADYAAVQAELHAELTRLRSELKVPAQDASESSMVANRGKNAKGKEKGKTKGKAAE